MKTAPVKPARSPADIRVSIVEDDARLRETLARLVDRSPGCCCVSRHPSGEDALANLPATQPDVVLMDINLPGMNGVECVRKVKDLLPRTQVMMLTVYEDTELIFRALSNGATGYLLKATAPGELIAAIADVHRGGSPMTSHIARKIVASFQQSPAPAPAEMQSLSAREREVLDLLAQGFLYKEIADKLGISYDTVHTHIRRIYEKLHVRSRTEAVAKHLRQGAAPGQHSGIPR